MKYLNCLVCVMATIAASVSMAKVEPDPNLLLLKDTGWSKAIKESKSKFECSRGQVMIGRKHNGDENGKTRYKCATVFNDGNEFSVTADSWSGWKKESEFTYICPVGQVMTGREHEGDENGKTRYKCSKVQNNWVTIPYTTHHWSEETKEDNSQYVCPKNQVMTGRGHFGDENGNSEYQCATFKPLYTETSTLAPKYKGESRGCVWQAKLDRRCPPFVIYCDQRQRHSLSLTVNQNTVFTSVRVEFDTSLADSSHTGDAAIFTMGVFGDIYASTKHPTFLFHHSSFFAGRPVAAAGEIKASSGKITEITSCSGHYRPLDSVARQALDSLKKQGFTNTIHYRSCSLLQYDYMILKSGDKLPPAELYFKKHESALLGPGKTIVCQRVGKRRDFCQRPISLKVPNFSTVKLCFQNKKCKIFEEGEHILSDGILKFADVKISAQSNTK